MKISSISIEGFRNFSTVKYEFPERVFITGPNGSGKTSILEAVNYFSALRSFREYNDRKIINTQSECFLMRMKAIREEQSITGGIRYNGSDKEIMFNGEKVSRISDAFGIFLSVIFSGYDKLLASKAPSHRRKFIDRILSLSDREYFNDLMKYHSVLKKRNFILKHKYNESLADTYAEQLSSYAGRLYAKRMEFMYYFNEVLTQTISIIYNAEKTVNVQYRSTKDNGHYTQNALLGILIHRKQAERQRGSTIAGPHLDDYEIMIDENRITHLGSDGERRLLGLAFKLAETELVYESAGEYPVVLLDDITAEIDADKKDRIMALFSNMPQVIIASPIIADNTDNYPVITLE